MHKIKYSKCKDSFDLWKKLNYIELFLADTRHPYLFYLCVNGSPPLHLNLYELYKFLNSLLSSLLMPTSLGEFNFVSTLK